VRLPPALAAKATAAILELLGEPPGHVLELGFAGIHAEPLRLAGFEVVVVEPDPAYASRTRERAGAGLAEIPHRHFDVVIAPEDADLRVVDASRALLVAGDGSVHERR
jgi:hypothetical protein